MEASKQRLLITGITGYIGSHIGKSILENTHGKYLIRASVRSLKNTNKLEPLRKAFGEELFQSIEFVEADLTNKESLFKAIAGCQYIVHVASPIPGAKNVKDEIMMKTAEIGMNAILEAAVAYKVKKIVITSSFSTIVGGLWKKDMGEDTYSEKDFAPLEGADGYSKSKITQERIVRAFLEEQSKKALIKDDDKIEIVTLHPTFVIGPTLINEENSSIGAIAKFMNSSVPGVPRLMTPCVDVRDVAYAHYLALEKLGLSGLRISITQESFWWKDIMKALKEEFNQYGYKIKDKEISYCTLKAVSLIIKQVKIIIPQLNREIYSANDLSKEVLGMKYERDLRKSFVEMGYSLIQQGLVKDKRKPNKQ